MFEKMIEYTRERVPRMVKILKLTTDPNIILDFYLGKDGQPMTMKEIGKKYGKGRMTIKSIIEIFEGACQYNSLAIKTTFEFLDSYRKHFMTVCSKNIK